MCGQCAGMSLCQLEFACACDCVRLCGNLNDELVPVELKLLAWGSVLLLSLLTRRLQTAALIFQRISCRGLSGCFFSAQLQALWQSAPPVRILRLHPVCKLSQCSACVKSETGKLLALVQSCSFQPSLPKPQIPFSEYLLSQNAWAHPTHGLLPNYWETEKKKELATKWTSWVNVIYNNQRDIWTLTVDAVQTAAQQPPTFLFPRFRDWAYLCTSALIYRSRMLNTVLQQSSQRSSLAKWQTFQLGTIAHAFLWITALIVC